MYSYGYTPFRIIRWNFSSHPQNVLVWLKFFFKTLLSRSFVFFVLHLSHPNNAVYSSEIFISSITFLHLSHSILLVPHKLLASLSRLDAINLQLSINLSWIFWHASVSSLFTPANLLLILTLKLMHLSLFSAMTPILFLLNLLPSSLINQWVS